MSSLDVLAKQTAIWLSERSPDWTIAVPNASTLSEWAKHFDIPENEAVRYWIHMALRFEFNPSLFNLKEAGHRIRGLRDKHNRRVLTGEFMGKIEVVKLYPGKALTPEEIFNDYEKARKE